MAVDLGPSFPPKKNTTRPTRVQHSPRRPARCGAYLFANCTPFSIEPLSSAFIFSIPARSNAVSGPTGRNRSTPSRPSASLRDARGAQSITQRM